MIIKELTLRQFRCFQERTIQFDGRIVVVEGLNGSGKSSLLEALHYGCYLRSFRTHLNRDLIHLGKDYFFINVAFQPELSAVTDQIQVGFSGPEGKVVKYNQKLVQSYKELNDHFRIVTLVADDIALIQGSPELRRDFLNYAILLHDPNVMATFKRYKQILDQRNSMLSQQRHGNLAQSEEFAIWTKNLWQESVYIRSLRISYLQSLENAVNNLLTTYFAGPDTVDLSVRFTYSSKNIKDEDQGFDSFWLDYKKNQLVTEQEWGRSLFGVHLDDFTIIFQSKKARVFASRGQQKLLVLLIKIAQLAQLSLTGEPGVLLLDDFMTDFDHARVEKCIAALKDLKFQMFLSCPISPKAFLSCLSVNDICHIRL